ncbi:hypothetical protein KC19_3G042600 [Ceratodon purpureus]|uniref:Uncharacterized protein n=1 Tax=Ceratodon purpureus TaxID=3225 RepID=A0A8T0II18_CERPU|nr:hypothetical protein KC19_3G042600 [Ceratodon purpureus]
MRCGSSGVPPRLALPLLAAALKAELLLSLYTWLGSALLSAQSRPPPADPLPTVFVFLVFFCPWSVRLTLESLPLHACSQAYVVTPVPHQPSLSPCARTFLSTQFSMRTVACLIVVIALMASFAGSHANLGHGRIGIHSALDGRWPDLVGRDAEEAKTIILNERPNLNVQILSSDMMMTMDYNTNRVRLIVNDERKIVKCPTIG